MTQSIDLSKLSPAPWKWRNGEMFQRLDDAAGNMVLWYTIDDDGIHGEPDDAEFIALARNAFDVMMRRGWHPVEVASDGWVAVARQHHSVDMMWLVENSNRLPTLKRFWPDPFTALVESDRWYRENVEKTNDSRLENQ